MTEPIRRFSLSAASQLRPATNVVTAVTRRWPAVGAEWASAVPNELVELCKRFNARAERTLPARYGFVVVASTPNGPLVLRASPDPAGKVQAEVSRALAKVGAGPAIHEVVVTNTGTWIAMEQIEPGIALDRATLSFDLLCRVRKFLHKLYEQPTPVLNMRGIDQWLRERLLDDHLTDVASGQFSVSAGERSQALDILDDLAAGPAGWNLCHGDLHAGNIIERADGRLFLIDPRGVSGEITYDVAVLALKAAHNSPVAARPLAVQFAAFVGLDAARAEAWVRVAAAARV